MKIGIIGTGNIGGNLTRKFRQLGHEVQIANSRGPDSLAGLAAETGAKAVTVKDAVKGRDLVVITIPEAHIRDLPKDLFAGAGNEVVVVDTGNYYPRNRDGRIDGIEDGLTESDWVEKEIGRPVIKAFNNIYAKHLLENGKPKGAPGRAALPVAGDNKAHKDVVMKLVDDMGFDPVDAGPLNQSWRQQPDTPVYGTDLDAEGTRRALAAASPTRKPEWRATKNSPRHFRTSGLRRPPRIE
jgi:predicted dinucleotide-binding enzyme